MFHSVSIRAAWFPARTLSLLLILSALQTPIAQADTPRVDAETQREYQVAGLE